MLKEGLVLLLITHFVASIEICPRECVCPSDVEMDCSNNNLDHIPMPTNPRKIEILRFARNSLREISTSTFQSFHNLRELVLDGNIIDHIEKNALKTLVDLELISLRSNVLEYLDVDVFATLVNLRSIDLSWNQLRNIDFDMKNLSNLVELYLSNNKLTSINEKDLLGTVNLNRISLDGNEITYIHPSALSHSFYLTYVILSYNLMEEVDLKLVSVGEIFRQLYLDLQHCRLKAFPRIESKTLSILILSNNEIRSFSREDVKNIGTSLLYLDVSRNIIDNIEDGTFSRFSEIVNLNFADNIMQQIPLELPQSVQELNFRNNSISQIIPNCFYGLSKLNKIDLSSNKLKDIYFFAFEGLLNLRDLDLSYNFIEKFDVESLNGLSALKTLSLAHNTAKNVSVYSTSAAEKSNNVDELILTESKGLCQSLMNFIGKILGNTAEIVKIDSCGLTGQNMAKILLVESIKTIKLCDNPWSCSESQWMVPFVEKYPQVYNENISCFNCRTSSGTYLSLEELKKPTTVAFTTTQTTKASTAADIKKNSTVPAPIVVPQTELQRESMYRARDILVIIAVIVALVLFFVIIVVAFNHGLKVRENQRRRRGQIGNNSYIRAESMVFSPLKDEIFYGTSKDPLIKTMERPPAKSAVDLEQFNAWIGSF